MNKVVLMGRLTRDPNVRYTQGNEPMCVARFTLAVDRRFKRKNEGGDEQTADFISCVAFGKQGEFVENYAHKGTKFALSGRIQTGSYVNKEGQTVYTTDVVVEEIEFAESKKAQAENGYGSSDGDSGRDDGAGQPKGGDGPEDGFMNVANEIDDDLPFH
ncbi:MAG: single-stranded DNA-binding protein [Lachnospiraceae bacterium]|nr:single-stranded DNA-binding protein [Lachnospiraceae bacterium]